MKTLMYSFFTFLFTFSVYAQTLRQPLEKHIEYLADDKLQGRMTGSAGEKIASDYIASYLKNIGFEASGTKGFLQPFDFISSRSAGKKQELIIDGKKSIKWIVLPFSASAKASGTIVDLGNGDYKNIDAGKINGNVVALEVSADLNNPHALMGGVGDLKVKAEALQKAGATGILYYSSDSSAQKLEVDYENYRSLSIPVALLYEFDKNSKEVKLKTEIEETKSTGHNVIGYLNKGGKYTVVLGAHYDHLGLGDEKHSRSREGKAVHNGADDNASGVAAVLELGRLLAGLPDFNFNVLIVAFSGEELGLLGSKHFCDEPTISLKNINCMLNYDMVGRVDSVHNLILNGTGTSPYFNEWIEKQHSGYFKFKKTESGVGPSDHTSFYLKDIPVMHFFSGIHPDYHKPSDDENLINYEGLEKVVMLSLQFLRELPKKERISFSKTKDNNNENAPRFTVTLGIVPDYVFSGEGVRADGVTEGKPAFAAGLKKGDIIVQLGEYPVSDMMSYMNALSKFKKGDKTKLEFLREGQRSVAEISF